MRILFLNPGGSLGGAERCLLDLAASIREHSRHAEVVLGLVAAGDGPLLAAAEARGMEVFALPFSEQLASVGDSALVAKGIPALVSFTRRAAQGAVEAPEYARRLRRAIRQFAPSIVHSNGIKMHLLAAAVRERVPLVWHIRDFIGARPLVSRAMSLLAGRATAAIAISNAVADDARRVAPRLPVSVLYDAIDTAVFAPEGRVADLDSLAGDDSAPDLRVGLVATYARWKGHDVFLRAAARLGSVARQRRVRFYVIGGPIYETAASQFREDELRSMVDDLGIQDCVRFIPFHEHVEDVYRALDIVVHASSRPEPFGRTIAEAMAAGKPLIASRDSGAAELFVDGRDAIATPAQDAEALAEAIRGLIVETRRREVLGRAARAAAVERFSRERLADGLFQIYRASGCMEDLDYRAVAGQA